MRPSWERVADEDRNHPPGLAQHRRGWSAPGQGPKQGLSAAPPGARGRRSGRQCPGPSRTGWRRTGASATHGGVGVVLFLLGAHKGGAAAIPWSQRRLRRTVCDVAAVVAALDWAGPQSARALVRERHEFLARAASLGLPVDLRPDAPLRRDDTSFTRALVPGRRCRRRMYRRRHWPVWRLSACAAAAVRGGVAAVDRPRWQGWYWPGRTCASMVLCGELSTRSCERYGSVCSRPGPFGREAGALW